MLRQDFYNNKIFLARMSNMKCHHVYIIYAYLLMQLVGARCFTCSPV